MKTLLLSLLLVLSSGPAIGQAVIEDTTSPAYQMAALVQDFTEKVQTEDSVEASEPSLVPYTKEIVAAARKYNLPPSMLAAVIQEESSFKIWATRTEPGYEQNRVVRRDALSWTKARGGIPTYATEREDRSRSYGLMQVMGQGARERGNKSEFLAELYLPENNVLEGAKLLRQLLDRYHGDTLSAISAYNQGNARKAGGQFVNARYVYRFTIAHEVYRKLLKKYEHSALQRSSTPNDPVDPGSPGVRRARLDAPQHVPARSTADRAPDSSRTDSSRLGAAAVGADQSGGSKLTPGFYWKASHDSDPPAQQAEFDWGLAAIFGIGFAVIFAVALSAGHDQRQVRSLDRQV